MRRTPARLLVLLLAGLSLLPPPVAAEETYAPESPQLDQVEFGLPFLNYFVWKNDRDFDRNPPLFDEPGQSVGYVAVSVFPRVTWTPRKALTFRYSAEIGGSFWSRTDVDPRPAPLEAKPVILHKEFWAQILLPWEGYGVRAGFQDFHDPTRLFIKKHVGAFNFFYQNPRRMVRFTVLQIPDTVFEGVSFEDNNFENDNFVFALDAAFTVWQDLRIRPGLYVQWDRTELDRTKWMFNPCVNLYLPVGSAGFWELDLVLQAGRWSGRSIDNRDLDILAGAVRLHGSHTWNRTQFTFNALVFTPDDGDPLNALGSGFTYSGFARSRTLVLSENWLYDQYDNLDERAAAAGAGMFLVDLFAKHRLGQGFELFGVVGYGMVLEPRFANNGRTIGTEIDAGVFWHVYPSVRFTALGGTVLPGRAGSAFLNELGSLEATDPIFYFQGAINVWF